MNFETIERIAAITHEYAVSEITIEDAGRRIHLKKSGAAPPARTDLRTSEETAFEESVPALVEEAEPEQTIILTAPMVGLFHHATPQVRYGATVSFGQNVGNIESMKLMNEVTALSEGRVAEVLIEDGAPVEYGQALFRLTAL